MSPTLLPIPRKLQMTSGTSSVTEPRVLHDPSIIRPEGYRLSITPDAIEIVHRDPAGAFYARQTLSQLQLQFGNTLPCLEIEDSPDFRARGVMLDISRDK